MKNNNVSVTPTQTAEDLGGSVLTHRANVERAKQSVQATPYVRGEETLEADRFFAQARDRENDFRNLQLAQSLSATEEKT